MTSIDYLIVGSGLTGATLARLLADAGREVLVLDRRAHLGGNVHDELHATGIRVQRYGPHFFRTNSPGIWSFLQRFTEFYDFQARIMTQVDGQLEAWPVTESYLRRAVGDTWEPGFRGTPTNFEEASLSMMPQVVYEKFVRDYTAKQWGVDPRTLDANLAKRFDVRRDDDWRLSRHRFQGLPTQGFAGMMQRMLAGIEVRTGVDYLRCREDFDVRRQLIFTGPIDEFYGYDLGALTYRGQVRQTEYLPHIERFQGNCVVNYPSKRDGELVRRMEWKQFMPIAEQPGLRGTVLTTETPWSPTDPNDFEYPFPNLQNGELYRQYRARAEADPRVLICGRLGEYRYFDMDQAIGRALVLAKRALQLEVSILDEDAQAAIPT